MFADAMGYAIDAAQAGAVLGCAAPRESISRALAENAPHVLDYKVELVVRP
jgi:hypothetical protein